MVTAWYKRLAYPFLLLVLFVGSFLVPVSLSKSSQIANLDIEPGRTRDGDTIHYRPNHSSNQIQEWETREGEGGSLKRGIRIRPDTPAGTETTWIGEDGDRQFERMEVTVHLGQGTRMLIELTPIDAHSPITVTHDTGYKVLQYRDFDGGGIIDLRLVNQVEDGVERLVSASVQYQTGLYEVNLTDPNGGRACTVITPDGESKELIFDRGLWTPKERIGDF